VILQVAVAARYNRRVPATNRYAFGPFVFDARARRLTCDGREVALTGLQSALLAALVPQAGTILPKDVLVTAMWGDVAVTDNSLEQVISSVRKLLADADSRPYIDTVARRGYRFSTVVTPMARRDSDEDLAALLAPHRAWIEGRAALETLDRNQMARAQAAFEQALTASPDQATAHVGLANACVMQYETTRSEAAPDVAALERASRHAREACRLDSSLGEAWATLGFVLARTGNRLDALAASRRAIALEPDNWRHQLRLASVGWGEERLRAAQRVLALLPGFPLAHFLAATVHVARGALTEAARELEAGIAAAATRGGEARFSAVALHGLLGLICLTLGDESRARDLLARECALEDSGHLYARECAANAWYALGALDLRRGLRDDARRGFGEARSRVARHPMAAVGLALATDLPPGELLAMAAAAGASGMPAVDRALAIAAYIAGRGDRPVEAGLHLPTMADVAVAVERELASAEPGTVGWSLPVEPLIQVAAAPGIWAPALARLRERAA
jgi:DNA-binding winged helix-turn-helix (wHTH) protein